MEIKGWGYWCGGQTGSFYVLTPPLSLTVGQRSRIISPSGSDAAQICTLAVASFLQDVALCDLVVHAPYTVCIDGRGGVYQWGPGSLARIVRRRVRELPC